MGNSHRDQWMSALPWVLLGKRVQYQPHLDASSAQLVLAMSPRIPGQLLGEPGPPLNTAQTRALLDQLYQLTDRPGIQTSNNKKPNNISHTEEVSHVYVKVDSPQSLCPKFEGPYEIYSRPSRSQVEVKIGLFKDGRPRLLTFHWSSCQVANLRDGAEAASRPALGRRPKATSNPHTSVPTYGQDNFDGDSIRNTSTLDDARPVTDNINNNIANSSADDSSEMSTNSPAKIQIGNRPVRSTRNPNTSYVHSYSQMPSPQNVVRW